MLLRKLVGENKKGLAKALVELTHDVIEPQNNSKKCKSGHYSHFKWTKAPLQKGFSLGRPTLDKTNHIQKKDFLAMISCFDSGFPSVRTSINCFLFIHYYRKGLTKTLLYRNVLQNSKHNTAAPFYLFLIGRTTSTNFPQSFVFDGRGEMQFVSP